MKPAVRPSRAEGSSFSFNYETKEMSQPVSHFAKFWLLLAEGFLSRTLEALVCLPGADTGYSDNAELGA